MDSLVNLNLVKQIANTEYELHSLIHLYLREKLDESKFMLRAKQDYCKLLVEKSERFTYTTLSPEKIEYLKPLIPHIKQITQYHYDYIVDDYNSVIPSDWNLPIKAINSFYVSQGFYPQAIQYFREYIDITKNKFGEGDIHLMVLYNDFSLALKDIYEYHEALKLLEKALSIAKKCLGKNHHETMMITNAIGDTYRQMEKYKEAEEILTTLYYSTINWILSNEYNIRKHPIFVKASPLVIIAQGFQHLLKKLRCKIGMLSNINIESNNKKEIAQKVIVFILVNNNLALVYQSIKKYQKAENCYKLILEIVEKDIQDKSSFAQAIFSQAAKNLGSLYMYMKRYEEAENYLVQALELNKRILDPKHLNYRLGLDHLACLYIIENKLDEAEKIVVELFELQLQLDYLEPKALKALEVIASQYFYKGLYEKVEQISLKINQLYQKFHLTSSIEYCESLNLLATSYIHVQKTEEAITLAKEAINIAKKLLPQSSRTKITISSATSLNIVIANSFNTLGSAFWNLAQNLTSLPQLSQRKQFLLEAEKCTKYSLELCKIDENSHDKEIKSMVSNIHNNLGLILEDLEKYSEAEKSYRFSLQLRREELGEESYLVGQSFLSLGACYDWQKKNNDQTEKMLLECNSIWEKLLKTDHPEMVHCYEHLGKFYNRTRQFKKAIYFYEKAVENCRVREDKNIDFYQQKLEECIKRSNKVKSKKSSKSSKKPKGFG
ncbi:tetratricopeptide repeat protein [Crocosphaera sp.]|uniref:tetratricopeptide repeat protein n=1 Tax=Crocosphaera sp. TaxID=2729996 RepID=UPI0026246DE7|nr:tetratricopeptide repeat protein [Crocosphaera sp.]MDJ0579636.1 tetratricopeptide repeat protein [Crocosphaera sp.]